MDPGRVIFLATPVVTTNVQLHDAAVVIDQPFVAIGSGGSIGARVEMPTVQRNR
jgi:hypothetical protein